jgi:glycosyltransferase involved in cell wall biosynthesis
MKHLIIIPIYNEAQYLPSVIAEIKKYLCEGADILAIDDGSTDETPRVLAGISGIEVMTHPTNLGYGRTLIDGFAAAAERGYDHVMTIDADWQHEPHLIREFCDALDEADIVSGSRYLRPSNEEPPADRRAINQRVTAMINEITGYGLTDAFCGFKAYRVEAVKRLELTEPGYGMPMQLWIQAWLKGLTVKEIPVGLVYFDRSRSFPGPIGDPEQRYRYYVAILERELTHDGCELPTSDRTDPPSRAREGRS